MPKRNLLIILIAAAAVVLVAVLSAVIPQQRMLSGDAPVLESSVPTDEPVAQETERQAEETAAPPKAYLLVSVKGMLYEPIPLYEESSYTVRQKESGAENVIHVTPNSVVMESSTCENQDCVLQGEVTLENLSTRVLGNMIICLPNEVTLELHTPQSLAEVLLQMEE